MFELYFTGFQPGSHKTISFSGSGKTTIVQKLAKDLSVGFTGFFTAEVRDSAGLRVGFDIETFAGDKGVLARNDGSSGPRVGQYTVFVKDFERIALPILRQPVIQEVILLDEIGKMELFSKEFEKAVRNLLKQPKKVVATVPVRSQGLRIVEEMKASGSTFHVTKSNREQIYAQILEVVKKALEQ